MSVPDSVIALVVASLPAGAYLWDSATTTDPPTDDLIVFDGSVPPRPPLRYVVVYADTGHLSREAMCATSDTATFRFRLVSVAPDGRLARLMAARVAAGVAGVRPVAAGWSCALVSHDGSQSPLRDEQVTEREVVIATDQYSVFATRA